MAARGAMAERVYKSDVERFCQAVSPSDEPCDSPCDRALSDMRQMVLRCSCRRRRVACVHRAAWWWGRGGI